MGPKAQIRTFLTPIAMIPCGACAGADTGPNCGLWFALAQTVSDDRRAGSFEKGKGKVVIESGLSHEALHLRHQVFADLPR